MEIFAHASEFAGTQPTVNAKSLLALSLVQMLFSIDKQLAVYRQRIEELFARHPDHDLFGSLPGAGPKLAPRLLSEIGDDRQRFDGDAQALQCLGGTAPVTNGLENTVTFTNAGLVTNISGTPSICLLNKVYPVVFGPSFTTGITAKRIAAMLMPYGDWAIAGSKSFTECGSTGPLTNPNFIIVTNSNTAPGSSSSNHPDNQIFP
jgi:transposase IS116/IS110/IS902 family protein